ncbi:hypothetical protein Tco_1538669 [Tanacetum coccineum]
MSFFTSHVWVTLDAAPSLYQRGDESTIRDIEFEGMTVARLFKMLQGTCMFPIKGIFFLVPGKKLSNELIHIKNDLDLANCIAIGYKNGKSSCGKELENDSDVEDVTSSVIGIVDGCRSVERVTGIYPSLEAVQEAKDGSKGSLEWAKKKAKAETHPLSTTCNSWKSCKVIV